MNKIILISGMQGAGKEEFLNVMKNYNLPFIRMGDLVRETYNTSGSNKTIEIFSNDERSLYGTNIWAERCLKKIKDELTIIEGCRSLDEFQTFKNFSKNIYIIFINAFSSKRYSRVVTRGRNDCPKNMKDFKFRDSLEISWGVLKVKNISDIIINNNSSIHSFKKKIDVHLKKILKK